MDTKKMIKIQNSDGTVAEVELVTYLVSEDNTKAYVVYSHGEKYGDNGDEVIYISKVASDGNVIKLEEITDDVEWTDVQKLLKKIANA